LGANTPLETGQIDPGLGHQGSEPGDEVERLEDMGGAIAVRRFELVTDVAIGRERQAQFRDVSGYTNLPLSGEQCAAGGAVGLRRKFTSAA